MIESKSIKNVRLRVVKSNIDARILYEKNNFVEVASFAEHTYGQD
ncbi:ribosomal protein S18 acetylase RimI-like enzyme [Brassicibacter mesophilus]